MKKILSIISTIIIIAALLGMTIPAFASSPNTGWLNINSSYSATGYVQCQPSYVEANYMQAYKGWVRVVAVFPSGSTGSSLEHYTTGGTGPNDSHIYTADSTLYYGNGATPHVEYGFTWVDSRTGYWPQSAGETE